MLNFLSKSGVGHNRIEQHRKRDYPVMMTHYVFLMLLFLSCQNTDTSTQQPLSLEEKIDQHMQVLHAEGQFNGTILIADSTGVIYDKAWGWADAVSKDTLTTQTVFYLGSIAKQFTAMSLMLLKHDGALTFEESVREYFPELPEFMDAVTIEHMLTHTSGIPDYYSLGTYEPGYTNGDVLEVAKNLEELDFEPGSEYSYSNTAYVLLSMIVERVADMSWREFLDQRIFTPLDMTYSQVFDETEPQLPTRAKGHTQEGSLDDYNAFTTGGGGIFSNIYDLYTWDQALYTDQLLQQEEIVQAYQPYELTNGETSNYGWGWMIQEENPMIVAHSGSLAGYRTYIYRDMESQFTIIILSNYTNEVAKIKDEVLELVGES